MTTQKYLRKIRAEIFVYGIRIKDIAKELEGGGSDGKMAAVNVSNVLRGFYNNQKVIDKALEMINEKKKNKRL
jgi:hypothetical protein